MRLPAILDRNDPMRRLFAYLRRYRGRVLFAVSSSGANKVLDLMPPLLTAWVIDSVERHPPRFVAALVPSGSPIGMAALLAALAVLIFGFESLFQWMYQYGFLTLAQLVQHDLRMDAYEKVQHREIAFFENHRTGETMAMLGDDINQLERFLNTGFNEILQLLVLFAFSGVVLFGTNVKLALVGLLPLPIVVLGSLRYQRLIAPRYRKVRKAVGELLARLENNLGGMLVIKSFTAEAYERERVREASSGYLAANVEAIKLSAAYIPIIRMAIAVGFAGVLLLGSYEVLTGEGGLTSGGLVLFAMMIQRLLWPLTRLGTTLDEYERARASARRTFGLIDAESAIQDPEKPVVVEEVRGEIRFARASFGYSERLPVLRDASFLVGAGETIGIAGPTGAGKSTLIKLILRLYDVTGGSITLDGIDLRDLTLRDLRASIALVSQEVYLFHGTIRENIAYSSRDVDLDAVIEAACLAELDSFVSGLPAGYETIVGERGIKLSGGQRQRLSIARALLKKAPILVLDEATSSVDTETERAIQRNLRRLTAGKTALIIAHRLSTIRHADRIIVLDQGSVAEEGSHETLLAKGGVYADLWGVQSGELIPAALSASN